MDKRSLLAILMITVIVIVWMVYMSVTQAPPPVQEKSKSDMSIPRDTNQENNELSQPDKLQPANDSIISSEKYGEFFTNSSQGPEEIIYIENELVKAEISSKGGIIKRWILKNFKSWNKYPTSLIASKTGELAVKFQSRETGKLVDTRDLNFKFIDLPNRNIILHKDQSINITLRLEPQPGKFIERKYTFYGDKYHFNLNIKLSNLDEYLTNKGYSLDWSDGLRYQEHNSVDESADGVAALSNNGENFEIDASGDDPVSENKTGIIDHAYIKTKYFVAGILPEPAKSFDGTVYLKGVKKYVGDQGVIEKYSISFAVPYRGGEATKSFKVYIGPLDYDIVSSYGLQDAVNFGWKLIVRPIGEFFMLPFFLFLYKLIGNYGIALIIFSIVMKLLLYPLSIQQMKSAQKMQLLNPIITEAREKYKDDNQKQQQEVMKIYSEYGINPAGGCLPLILQMPILYALWSVLRTSIDLRQAYFGLWIKDLSIPDYIVELPFSLLGISHLSGLALLMGVTMFIQQKMSITDPKQKALVYMMPVMFTLMFSNFPSGLNLYYFMFNLIGIIQQVYMNKFSKNKPNLQELKRSPKKEGWFQKKMKEAQEIAQNKGKSIPGQQNQIQKSKYTRKTGQKNKK